MKNNAEDHLKLVSKIAGRYNKGNRMEYEDIFQEGCIGLIRACNEYVEGDVPFGAFAAMHINFSILRALSSSSIIKVSHETVCIAAQIKRNGLKDNTVEEIAKELGKTNLAIEKALTHLKRDVLSLDFEYRRPKSDKSETLLDFCKYEHGYAEDLFVEQILDFYQIPERDKKIYRLVMVGHTFKDAIEMCGEDYKASVQRRKRHQWLWKKDRHLIFE